MPFQGQTYPCRIDGLSIGEVSISSTDAIGNVYHLTHNRGLQWPLHARQPESSPANFADAFEN